MRDHAEHDIWGSPRHMGGHSEPGADLVAELDSSGSVIRFGAAAEVLGLSRRGHDLSAWELLQELDRDDAARLVAAAAAVRACPAVTVSEQVTVRRPGRVPVHADVEVRGLAGGALSVRLTGSGPAPALLPGVADLVAAAPSAMALIDGDGRLAAASGELCRLLGVRPSEVMGRTQSALVHPADAAVVRAMEQAMAAGARAVQAELRWRRPDGGTVAVLDRRARPGAGDVTIVLLTLAGVGRRSGEAEQSIARTVADASGQVLLAVDADGIVVFANEACRQLLAGSRGAGVAGRTLGEVLPPQSGAGAVEQLVARAASGEVVGSHEVELLSPDGKVHVLVWDLVAVDDPGRGRLVVLTGSDATEKRAAIVDLTHQALHDPLTDLPNRRLVRDRLSHALRSLERRGGMLAVLFVDLDGFKAVNDRFGHQVGDSVLRVLAERLAGLVRPTDTVARFGGDEFVAVLETVDDDAVAFDVARRLVSAIEQEVVAHGEVIRVSATVGVAFGRDPDADPDVLISQADAAMYEGKRRARAGDRR